MHSKSKKPHIIGTIKNLKRENIGKYIILIII